MSSPPPSPTTPPTRERVLRSSSFEPGNHSRDRSRVDLNQLFTFVAVRFGQTESSDADACPRTDDMRVAAALPALTLASPAALATFTFQTVAAQTIATAKPDIAGAWVLNRDLTVVPQRGDRERPGGEQRGGGGHGGGRGGLGGGFGHGGGMGGGAAGPSDEQIRKMQVVRRHLTEVPDRLIVVRDPKSVSITDGNGLRMNYKVDGKKQDQFTGDGEFTTKSRFDGDRLVVEEDFGGRKVTVTYTPVLDGDKARLEVTVKAEGGREGGGRGGPGGSSGEQPAGSPRELKRVYDLEARGQPGLP